MLVFVCALLGASAGTAGQPKAADTIAERVAACTTCHGKEGRATESLLEKIIARLMRMLIRLGSLSKSRA